MNQDNAKNTLSTDNAVYLPQHADQVKLTFSQMLAVICELLSGDVSDLEQLNSHN